MSRLQESGLLRRVASIVALLAVLCSTLCHAADSTYHDYLSSLLQPAPVVVSNRAGIQDEKLYREIINKIGSTLDVSELVSGYSNLTSSMKVIDNSYSFNDSSTWNVAFNSLRYQSDSMRKHDLKLESNSPSFTCESLPSSYDPSVFCSGVVDYSFVLPLGLSKESFESYVRAESQRAIPLASTQCQSDIKRVICAKYYLPCLDNVVADDYTTYQWIGSIPIPYKRPCESLCTATTYLGDATSCHGLLESLGLDFQCSGNALGLPIPEFDSTNDPSTCNSLPSTANSLVVASPVEPYVGKTCAGIADQYYVQAPFVPGFAPLLPPFVAQSVAEAGVAAVTKVLPRYFSSDCLEAYYKVMCATFIMKPFKSDDLAQVFGVTYFPSFPSNSLCQDYNDKCSALFALVPEAKLDCDTKLAGGALSLYPSSNQIVAIIPIGPFPIVIQTPPNTLENVNIDIMTECPLNFSPVDIVVGTEVRVVGDCYINCDITLYDHPDAVLDANTVMYFLSTVVLLATITNLIITPAKKRNVYACMIILVKLVVCLIIGIHRGSTNLSNRGCATKTATYPVPPRDYYGSICLAEGISAPISKLIVVACVYCSILELWFRVVWSVKDIKRIQFIYRACAVGLVVMHILVLFLGLGQDLSYYYGKCNYEPSNYKLTFYSNAIPQMIYYISGLGLSVHVIYVCISISSKTSNKAERWYSKIYKYWKLYKVLFLIVATFFLGNFLDLFLKDTYIFDRTPVFVASFVEHVLCVFLNFVSKENDNSIQQCGYLPKEYLSGAYVIFFFVCQYLTDYLWFFITLNNDVKNFWYSKLLIVSGKLAKHRTVESSVYQSEGTNNDDDDDKDDDKETEQSKAKPSIVIKSNFNDKVVPLDVESATVIDYESKHCDA